MKTKIKQVTAATLIVLSLMVIGINASATKLTGCKIVESSLELEDWMTDETIWSTANTTAFAQEKDVNMAFESWMTNDEIWNVNYHFVAETETSLEIENWMIDAENWDVNDLMKGSELALEIWEE
ncbi:hypothetical protein [uncultured Draconibacterium sp.]|uniref:hypothetical protein n=1 Tax=uncultured Draconibacterium sp. TaxID=1573823 RepID=UPI0029C73E8B|nr:hypothetical protein [uncultured Draconibacterium sp.]